MKDATEQLLQLAIDTHMKGRLDEADPIYRAVLTREPKHSLTNQKLGELLLTQNKIDEAVPLFEVAIETEPESEKLWLSLIDALIKGERYDEARATIDQGKDQGINPDKLEGIKNLISSSFNFPEYVKLIIENYKAGNLPETERLALIITRELPDDAFAWKVLGTVYEQTGRTSDALMANTKVTDFSPEEPEGHNNLGVTYKSLGRLEEAEASFRQALLLQSDYAKAYNNLGTTLEEQGRLSEAEESISRAVELDPDYVEAQNNLGNVLTRLGKYAEAEQTFKQALALKPENAEVHGNLGSMFQHDGRLNESEFSLRQAIELNPDYVEAHINLGNVLQELGRIDEAQASYRQALALKPDHAKARYNLGTLLHSARQYEEASLFFKGNREKNAQSYLLKCLYNLDDSTGFYEQLDLMTAEGEISPTIGSLTMRAENRYGVKRANVFARDPFKYVLKKDLAERYDFEDVFVKTVKEALNDKVFSVKAQGLLTNGEQTAGNLFSKGTDSIKEIERILHAEIDEYRERFQNCEEGFLINWPTQFELYGWLINMKSGGELAAHMHEIGWISGAVYINVPEKKQANSGNFVVCVDGESSEESGSAGREEIIEVNTGNLVLFPASLMHYTIPFESHEERIVLAFDVRPVLRSS